jgi:hypothetical protein
MGSCYQNASDDQTFNDTVTDYDGTKGDEDQTQHSSATGENNGLGQRQVVNVFSNGHGNSVF